MQELRDRVRRIANSGLTLLIEGEAGTGKTHVAREIHRCRKRQGLQFWEFNCAAATAQHVDREFDKLQESTPAIGTVVFDRIDELPHDGQARLVGYLRLLEESSIQMIATAQAKLISRHRENRLRSDLFYRFHGIGVDLPPLRERGSDPLLLARHFLAECEDANNTNQRILTDGLKRAIRSYDWPGNIHELKRVMYNALTLKEGEHVGVPMTNVTTQPLRSSAESPAEDSAVTTLEEYFIRFVTQNEEFFSETELAQQLGISRKSLWERRQRLGIPRKRTRQRGA